MNILKLIRDKWRGYSDKDIENVMALWDARPYAVKNLIIPVTKQEMRAFQTVTKGKYLDEHNFAIKK